MSPDNVIYRPNPIIRLLKSLMLLLRRLLPQRFYDCFYDFAFSVYRMLLRLLYSRHLFLARLAGDEKQGLRRSSILRVMPHSLVGSGGLEATYDLACAIEDDRLPGGIVECGVAEGGSAALMALVAARNGNQRDVWLFDSFEEHFLC